MVPGKPIRGAGRRYTLHPGGPTRPGPGVYSGMGRTAGNGGRMAEIHADLIPRDTLPAMAQKQFEMLMALPAGKRLRMASDMFASARRLLMSDLEERKVPAEKWPGDISRRVSGPGYPPEARERPPARMDGAGNRHAA